MQPNPLLDATATAHQQPEATPNVALEPSLQLATEQLWATMRTAADLIVTLRVENAQLQKRIEELERMPAPVAEPLPLNDVSAAAPEVPVDVVDANDERNAAAIAEREELQNELNRAIQIIERYRSYGLRHLEDPQTEDQLMLFGVPDDAVSPAFTPNVASALPQALTDEELDAVADALDHLADRLEELAGLS